VLLGLVDREKPLGNHVKFTEAGFTISRNYRHSQSLGLHSMFGKFSVEGVDDWKPFSENMNDGENMNDDEPGLWGFLERIQIPMPSIRLCLQDFFDLNSNGPRAFFRLHHSLKMSRYSELAYELETREARHGERLFELTFHPVTVDHQQPLTLMQLLESFDLHALSEEDVPSFVIAALNGISITCFRLGWAGDLGPRRPDYLEVGVRVEKLSIAGSDSLSLDSVYIRLRIDSPLRKEKRNVFLQSGGVIRLLGVEAVGRMSYGIHPLYAAADSGGGNSAFGPVELSIGTTDTPLTLGNILNHFWPETHIIPELAQRKMKTGSSAQFQDQAFKIDYPKNSGLGVLDEIEIQDFTFIVGKGEESGKYGIDEFSISASSDLHLEIWHDKRLRLERVTLQAGYEAQVGFNFNFGSEFYIDEHIILATMGYGRLLSGGFFW